MATCRKVTLKDRILTAEHAAGRKLTAPEKLGLELVPPQYTCTGPGVAGAKSKKPAK